ncbi:hypothetical protein KA977_02960 [Candidatus Dependentiae bacterium]|nr:hypothetical protein [Candidatus Dependentiae bacterium]
MNKPHIQNLSYKIYNKTLSFISNNDFIIRSINSYFSVYNNLHKFRCVENINIELYDVNFHSAKLNKISKFETASNSFLAEHKNRFKIYRVNRNIYCINFYNGLSKIFIDIKNCKAEGYIVNPERFGLDFIPNFIIIALIEILFKFKNIFFIHSSAVVKNGTAILFPGSSGSGKSTLAFYMMSKKFNLISDDKCFIYNKNEETIEISGLLQPVDIIKRKDDFLINSGLIKKVFNKYSEDEKRFIITEFKKNSVDFTGKIKFIIFPKIGEKFNVKKISKNNALTSLFKNSITPRLNINLKQHFEILYKTIENSECYSIIVSSDLTEFYKFIKKALHY